jgi:hypothetical protein
VTYAQNPPAHLKVEFGFDVLQVARGNYAPQSYHDFIGFRVSKPLLERSFQHTYGIKLEDIFHSLDLALGTYRRAVSSVIPTMTKAAWKLKKDDLQKANPSVNRRKFVYYISRASYEKEWGKEYEKPKFGATVLAFFISILPKVGPFSGLAFKTPVPKTVLMFQDSFDHTVDLYRKLLPESQSPKFQLANRDFDTGQLTRPGEYPLADEAYAKLVRTLAGHSEEIPSDLQANIELFFSDLKAPYATKQHPEEWHDTLIALSKLNLPVMPAADRRQ